MKTDNEEVSYPFEITVPNSAPEFKNTPLPEIKLYRNDTKNLTISTTDEEGHPITLTYDPTHDFIIFNEIDTLKIQPNASTPAG